MKTRRDISILALLATLWGASVGLAASANARDSAGDHEGLAGAAEGVRAAMADAGGRSIGGGAEQYLLAIQEVLGSVIEVQQRAKKLVREQQMADDGRRPVLFWIDRASAFEKTAAAIRKELEAFREELIELAEKDANAFEARKRQTWSVNAQAMERVAALRLEMDEDIQELLRHRREFDAELERIRKRR